MSHSTNETTQERHTSVPFSMRVFYEIHRRSSIRYNLRRLTQWKVDPGEFFRNLPQMCGNSSVLGACVQLRTNDLPPQQESWLVVVAAMDARCRGCVQLVFCSSHGGG